MAYFRTCHSQDLYMILQDLDNHTGERDCRFTKSRWDLFFYILLWYWWNSTSEILADVTREAPSTTSFIDDSRITFSYRSKKSTQVRVVEGSVRCSGTTQQSKVTFYDWKLDATTTTSSLSDFQPVFLYTSEPRLEGSIEFRRHRRRSTVLTTASSIADRVTTILHPSYEAYLVKFFSHSHLPLCTEDLVVLKSVSISKPWREVNPETDCFSELPHG